MAVGPSASEANTFIDGLSGAFLQMHNGDPGAAGTANTVTETSRKVCTLGAASGGSATNSVALTWTGISGTATPTHATLWTLATAGVFRHSGTITTAGYVAGNTFTIAIGDVTVSVPIIAA